MTGTMTIIPVTGGIQEIDRDTPPSLEALQWWVGGYVEVVSTQDRRMVIANEDGRLSGFPVNPRASHMMRQELVGTVIILEGGARLK